MDRREFLRTTGATAMAGWTVPLSARLAGAVGQEPGSATDPSWERRFAKYAADVTFDRIPPGIVSAAKAHLLDTLGCAFGGVGSEPARIAEATFRQSFGSTGHATVIGKSTTPLATEGAALVNGVLTRVLDFNDTYSGIDIVHPSEVIPAAIACSEEAALNGRQLLEAMVVGYEVETRLVDAFSFLDRGFYSVTAGGVAVPLIAAKCWGMSAEAAAHAIGISFSRQLTMMVVSRGEISMMKALPHAHTAMDGIFAARLAKGGFTGPSGSIAWLAAEIHPKAERFAIDMDASHFSLDKVAFKRFPLQMQLHTVVEAAVNLSSRLKGRMGDVRGIVIKTYPDMKRNLAGPEKYRPASRETADHSLPICAAMALVDGDVTVSNFDQGRWKAGDVLAVAAKIEVVVSEELVAKNPRGSGATLTVRLNGGEELTETIEVPEGDPRRPLSRQSLEHKFRTLTEPVLGRTGATTIIDMVSALDEVGDVRNFTKALRG